MGPFLEVEVFRAGDYGPKGRYGADDLDAISGDYDPSLHEAPVTVDHAQSGPAFGWVHSLARRGDVLVATLRDLGEGFVNLIRSGAFKKRSVEIYRQFKATGRPYLRAISFLGACPPEVKGLADPVFAEGGGHEVIEFDEKTEGTEGNDGIERPETTEDSDKPGHVARPARPAQPVRPDPSDPSDEAGVSEAVMAETAPAEPLQERIAFLSEEKERLKAEVTAMADRAVEQARQWALEAHRDDILVFCRMAVAEGRIVPAWERAGIAEFMMTLADPIDIAVAESPADDVPDPGNVKAFMAKSGMTPLEWFQSFIEALPALTPMGESASERSKGGRPAFESRLPLPGSVAPVSKASVAIHEQAVALQEARPGLSYAEALREAAKER